MLNISIGRQTCQHHHPGIQSSSRRRCESAAATTPDPTMTVSAFIGFLSLWSIGNWLAIDVGATEIAAIVDRAECLGATQLLFERILDQTFGVAEGIWIGTPVNLTRERESRELERRMPEIQHPHLVVWGEGDGWIAPADLTSRASPASEPPSTLWSMRSGRIGRHSDRSWGESRHSQRSSSTLLTHWNEAELEFQSERSYRAVK
jgi:pimeloyl-ACP methyl ester carboxylesterase